MSGHSHAKKIKREKEITDKKRGQIFSKLSRMISVATREKGPNLETNPRLRLAIEEARFYNLPKDNIERAIKRGTGESTEEKLEEVIFEAFGPAGIAIIIEGITSNKNRAFGEIKQILSQNNGKMANEGSVRWLFEKRGIIIINNKQKTMNDGELELKAIEAGAEDIYWRAASEENDSYQEQNNILDVYTKSENLETVKKALEDKKIKIESASLDWIPKEMVEIEEKDKEAAEKLFNALDENDAVQNIYSNLKT